MKRNILLSRAKGKYVTGIDDDDCLPKKKKSLKNKILFVIRCILGLAMCYFIYTETGFFTALFALLMLISTEMHGHMLDVVGKYIHNLNKLRNDNN